MLVSYVGPLSQRRAGSCVKKVRMIESGCGEKFLPGKVDEGRRDTGDEGGRAVTEVEVCFRAHGLDELDLSLNDRFFFGAAPAFAQLWRG